MPAPNLANCAACSYTVTSMPTRRSAAAAARPPMPAPTIAIVRGLVIDSLTPGRLNRLPGQQKISLDFTQALDRNATALGKIVICMQPPKRGFADLDLAALRIGFHPAGQIDGVAPEVEREFLGADDP